MLLFLSNKKLIIDDEKCFFKENPLRVWNAERVCFILQGFRKYPKNIINTPKNYLYLPLKFLWDGIFL